ncbi:AhpC/TSA family protein [Aquiflexum balticum DSM 16537]|uniref:AhpC/TSA family protein n=1 Tax=Aquiflexum balticum DSM 16537 TaxID=758820 RepID=A0A1W2H5X5_9BACT|nr:redoxin domain-containing protein [Aquiflexum balticum]SMD44259.1 AhpC/TSA family protein [Aquiflexum balticum DSM 16537]
MKHTILILLFFIGFVFKGFSQRVENFQLKDALTSQVFELDQHQDKKAIVLVFTSLNCPFSKLYEDRIIDLENSFSPEGFVFAMINPHSGNEEEENTASIRQRIEEKGFKFPFLEDNSQVVTKQFGITKLPEVVVITPSPTGYAISYRGAIDNNPQVAANANMKYLENALTAIQIRRNPSPSSSRPVGCNVKLIN